MVCSKISMSGVPSMPCQNAHDTIATHALFLPVQAACEAFDGSSFNSTLYALSGQTVPAQTNPAPGTDNAPSSAFVPTLPLMALGAVACLGTLLM
jgi:hypothetical protein